jgi:hypothetical protein
MHRRYPSQVVEAAGTDSASVRAKTITQSPCQKFARNCATRSLMSPHDPTLNSASQVWLCGHVRFCEGS